MAQAWRRCAPWPITDKEIGDADPRNAGMRPGVDRDAPRLGGEWSFAAARTNVRNEIAAGYEVIWPSGPKAAQSS